MKYRKSALFILMYFFLMIIIFTGAASGNQDLPQTFLMEMSIEDLLDIEVTLTSRKPQKISQAAAAVFVITNEDIRRSGATSIPELLRMVPGLQVARISSNKWAVTSRGFNRLYANKLLILIDGRTTVL